MGCQRSGKFVSSMILESVADCKARGMKCFCRSALLDRFGCVGERAEQVLTRSNPHIRAKADRLRTLRAILTLP